MFMHRRRRVDHPHLPRWGASGVWQDHCRGAGIIDVMSSAPSRRFPVTVTHLPVTHWQLCQRTVAYRPGKLSEVLTEHYLRAACVPARR